MCKVKRYNFKLGISRGKVKKILNSHDIKFPKGLVVKKLNNIDYISFTYEFKISSQKKFNLENDLNPKFKSNKSRRARVVDYDERTFDSILQFLIEEN